MGRWLGQALGPGTEPDGGISGLGGPSPGGWGCLAHLVGLDCWVQALVSCPALSVSPPPPPRVPQLLARDLRGEMTPPAVEEPRPSLRGGVLGRGVAQLLSLRQVQRGQGAWVAGPRGTGAECPQTQPGSGAAAGAGGAQGGSREGWQRTRGRASRGGWRGLGGPEGRLQRVHSLQTVALAWWGSSGPAASPGAPAHMDTMGAWAREGAEGWLSGLGCGPQAGSRSRQWLGPPWPPSLPCLWAKCPDVAQGHPVWLLPRGPPCASVSPLRSEHGDRPVREGGEGVGSGHVCTAEFSGRGQGSRTAEASGRGQGSRMAEASGRGQGSEVLLPPPSAGGR